MLKSKAFSAALISILSGLLLDGPSSRPFLMGFTPWPYDATAEAIEETYQQIQLNGDIVAHHLMDGIPWQASYTESAYPIEIENELLTRLNATVDSKAIYLALDSLNGERSGLSFNWGAEANEALPSPWDTRRFDDEEVIAAYSNFALDMIERFDPDYFNYASEISDLMLQEPARFTEFVTFSAAVYSNLKAAHPDLPLMVSIALKSPESVASSNISDGFARIAPYVDIVGISLYPYAFYDHEDKGDPATLPLDWLSQIRDIAPGKRLAVTETAWPAEDLNIEAFGLNEDIDAAKQNSFLLELFGQSEALRIEFIIWFSLIDYDALWTAIGQDDTSRLWRDSGLLDESLQARPALNRWRQYYLSPYTRDTL